jgi:hypothetical protein
MKEFSMKNEENVLGVGSLGSSGRAAFHLAACMLGAAGLAGLSWFCGILFSRAISEPALVWFAPRLLYAGIPFLLTLLIGAAWHEVRLIAQKWKECHTH